MPVHWYVAGCNRISGLAGSYIFCCGGMHEAGSFFVSEGKNFAGLAASCVSGEKNFAGLAYFFLRRSN
jgi:hypothetical protein